MNNFIVRGYSYCGSENKLDCILEEYFEREEEAYAFFQRQLTPREDEWPYAALGWGEIIQKSRRLLESDMIDWRVPPICGKIDMLEHLGI